MIIFLTNCLKPEVSCAMKYYVFIASILKVKATLEKEILCKNFKTDGTKRHACIVIVSRNV